MEDTILIRDWIHTSTQLLLEAIHEMAVHINLDARNRPAIDEAYDRIRHKIDRLFIPGKIVP